MQGIANNSDRWKDMIRKVTIVLVCLELIYIVGFFVWITGILPEYEENLLNVYVKLNPFTIGSYGLGLAVLLSYVSLKKAWIKMLLSMAYGLILIISCVAVMGIFQFKEMVIYLPHVGIILACIWIEYRKYKKH